MSVSWAQIHMMIWAATLPLMPYAIFRKRWDALAGLVVLFFMLLINVLMLLNFGDPSVAGEVPVVR